MKTLNLNIFACFVLALFFSSCEKTPPTPSGNSNTQINVDLHYNRDTYYKTGEDDDRPFVDTISGQITSSSQNNIVAVIDLLDSTNNILIDSTVSNSSGYFFFYSIGRGSYIVIVYVDGEVIETFYVSI